MPHSFIVARVRLSASRVAARLHHDFQHNQGRPVRNDLDHDAGPPLELPASTKIEEIVGKAVASPGCRDLVIFADACVPVRAYLVVYFLFPTPHCRDILLSAHGRSPRTNGNSAKPAGIFLYTRDWARFVKGNVLLPALSETMRQAFRYFKYVGLGRRTLVFVHYVACTRNNRKCLCTARFNQVVLHLCRSLSVVMFALKKFVICRRVYRQLGTRRPVQCHDAYGTLTCRSRVPLRSEKVNVPELT